MLRSPGSTESTQTFVPNLINVPLRGFSVPFRLITDLNASAIAIVEGPNGASVNSHGLEAVAPYFVAAVCDFFFALIAA